MKATLLFPHQLFSQAAGLANGNKAFLVEHPLFFKEFPFHKQKLMLHRASMRKYADGLRRRGVIVNYVEATAIIGERDIAKIFYDERVTSIVAFDPVDDWGRSKLEQAFQELNIAITWIDSPNFLMDRAEITATFGPGKPLRMGLFYIEQRKRLNILIENGLPVGGKWSFDAENRKRLPKNIVPPPHFEPKECEYVREARNYVESHFPDNPGSSEDFRYPIDSRDALKGLDDFLEHRIDHYGEYQDAIDQENSRLYHSILTPALNIGLLSPDQIVHRTLARHKDSPIPMNSLEGFLRQVIGWREFVRGVYELRGRTQRTSNFFKHRNKIPVGFWRGNTGIEPLDKALKGLLKTGYLNHIERLMLFSNFMLLSECDPDAVYHWFMALFIDSYDWVMVPNVYGMGQYADGGSMVTKPYVSSSNYVRKMSHYKPGEWSDIWDSLYWRFMNKHRVLFDRNPRTRMTTKHLDRMGEKKLKAYERRAQDYLSSVGFT